MTPSNTDDPMQVASDSAGGAASRITDQREIEAAAGALIALKRSVYIDDEAVVAVITEWNDDHLVEGDLSRETLALMQGASHAGAVLGDGLFFLRTPYDCTK